MAVVMFATSLMSVAPDDDCLDWAWSQADKLNKLSGNQWSGWDLWDVTNALYEDCIGE